MPTISQQLYKFYNGLDVYFRFSQTQVRKISLAVKRAYDAAGQPPITYTLSKERRGEFLVRNYPDSFIPEINKNINYFFTHYIKNVKTEVRRGNKQPLKDVKGDLPPVPKQRIYKPAQKPIRSYKINKDKNNGKNNF